VQKERTEEAEEPSNQADMTRHRWWAITAAALCTKAI
jgi:hypothetical protein